MAWNDSGNGKNPWDRGGGGNDGPPDLDKILRDWQKRINSFFGGGGRKSGSSSGSGPGGPALLVIFLLILGVWAFTGLYRVNEDERGVVLRFGAYHATTSPGLRWHIPAPIESVEKVNITQIIPFSQQTKMLTSDENIVEVDLVVQYQKSDPVAYLFNVRDPDATLSDISESAIREVVGKSNVDFVLLEGRAEIAQQTQVLIQDTLDDYGAGIVVTKVALQDTNFPAQVEAAVQDAIKAREDRERLAFEAQSYANDILPKARGEGVRRIEDAEAYKSRVIADAEGEASRFEQLLVEYQKAPSVTRERLYLEAIEDVFASSSKVLLDAKGSGNLVYLPLDKLMERSNIGVTPNRPGSASGGGSLPAASSRSVDDVRARRSR